MNRETWFVLAWFPGSRSRNDYERAVATNRPDVLAIVEDLTPEEAKLVADTIDDELLDTRNCLIEAFVESDTEARKCKTRHLWLSTQASRVRERLRSLPRDKIPDNTVDWAAWRAAQFSEELRRRRWRATEFNRERLAACPGTVKAQALQALESTIQQLTAIIENNPPEMAFAGTWELAYRIEKLCEQLELPYAIQKGHTSGEFRHVEVCMQYPYGDFPHCWVLHDSRGRAELERIKRDATTTLQAWSGIIPFWLQTERAANSATEVDTALRDASDESSRWVLFYRDSAARHAGDEADTGCVLPWEWKPFACVDDCSRSEVSVLLKALADELYGTVVDDGSIHGNLCEFDAAPKTELTQDAAAGVRALRELRKNTSSGDSEASELATRAHGLAMEIRALRRDAKTVKSTERPSGSAETPDISKDGENVTVVAALQRLSEAEERIREVVCEAGRRLTTKEILAVLRGKHGAASEGTTKACLAGMVRRGILTNRQDVVPRGYGLAKRE